MYLSVALWNITYVIVPEAFSNKTPWFGLIVWVPTLVVPLKRSQLCQLLLGEPLSLESEIKIILSYLILSHLCCWWQNRGVEEETRIKWSASPQDGT